MAAQRQDRIWLTTNIRKNIRQTQVCSCGCLAIPACLMRGNDAWERCMAVMRVRVQGQKAGMH